MFSIVCWDMVNKYNILFALWKRLVHCWPCINHLLCVQSVCTAALQDDLVVNPSCSTGNPTFTSMSQRWIFRFLFFYSFVLFLFSTWEQKERVYLIQCSVTNFTALGSQSVGYLQEYCLVTFNSAAISMHAWRESCVRGLWLLTEAKPHSHCLVSHWYWSLWKCNLLL